jgi:multidrug efflux pump subunit AcrA (membrane-fusion protein)
MEVKAPADGVVYFGRCVSGRWAEMSSLISKLQPFGTASPNSVLMTIVKPRPLFVTATVDEEDRPSVEKGQPAKVVPPPKNSDKLAAKVSSVSIAPVSSTNFQVDFELDDAAPADWIVAGMSCDIKVTTYDKVEALAIPEDAVHTDDENTDDEDEDERYVWVVDPDNSDAKPKRRTVTIGKQSDDRLEIVDGLATGDVISLEDEDEETDDE